MMEFLPAAKRGTWGMGISMFWTVPPPHLPRRSGLAKIGPLLACPLFVIVSIFICTTGRSVRCSRR